MKLSGNTMLITGGSSGIGFELAKAFLELGNNVIITRRDDSKLKYIRQHHPQMQVVRYELTDPVSLNELLPFIRQNHVG